MMMNVRIGKTHCVGNLSFNKDALGRGYALNYDDCCRTLKWYNVTNRSAVVFIKMMLCFIIHHHWDSFDSFNLSFDIGNLLKVWL